MLKRWFKKFLYERLFGKGVPEFKQEPQPESETVQYIEDLHAVQNIADSLAAEGVHIKFFEIADPSQEDLDDMHEYFDSQDPYSPKEAEAAPVEQVSNQYQERVAFAAIRERRERNRDEFLGHNPKPHISLAYVNKNAKQVNKSGK